MRTIPSVLQTHLEQSAQTTALLLKYVCRDGTTFGFTDHDRDIDYDDGDGLITYVCRAGYDVSQIAATSEIGVDNAEGSGLIPLFTLPDDITEDEIDGGKMDNAEFWLWIVNVEDVDTESPYSAKHAELMSGTVGQVRTVDGQVVFPELRSLSQQMQQNFVPETSLTCRYVFGSTECGVDAEALWESSVVTAVGVEDDRTFTIALAHSASFYKPGLVQFLTGDNEGRYFEIEDNEPSADSPTGTEITLSGATAYAIQAGDTLRARPDCRKRFVEDCIGVYANGNNFGGEPYIPVNDEDGVNVPGVQG
jgi:uncharacterized phage protein (TIGR02218 family)